jgi:hypothetical protein
VAWTWKYRAAVAAATPVGLALTVVVMVVALFSLTDQYAVISGDHDGETTQKGLWGSDTGVMLETRDRLALPPDMVKAIPVVPTILQSVLPTATSASAFSRSVLTDGCWCQQNGQRMQATR